MNFPFDSQYGLIIVRAELTGPSGSAILRLALDTGATGTLVNVGMLVSIGYDPALVIDRFQITTGSGVEFVPRITVSKIAVLGQEREDLPVLCHTLPPSSGIDGLLGLDFFRGQSLTLDFRTGKIIFG
ncbi:MAG: retroviral-like aspartic protease family protein [Nitrososphaera sp.]